MEAITRDIRLAVRRLRMAPGFTVFAAVSLALGIGVSTAIYSAVRTLLWTPLGIVEPARAVSWTEAGRVTPSLSWPDFVDIRAQQASFISVATARRLHATVALGDTVETVFGESVSGDYFATLGVNALHGRVLQPQDETARARVAVVSESFWRSRLHADPAAVGRSFKLSGETFEIVGVARGTFHGVHSFLPGSIWIPEVAVPDKAGTGWPARQMTDRRLGTFAVWGRLKPGVMRRTREIGIRIAMGADRSRIFALILRDGLRPVVKGLVLGLAQPWAGGVWWGDCRISILRRSVSPLPSCGSSSIPRTASAARG